METATLKKYQLEPNRTICTVISKEAYEWCRINNITWQMVIVRGMQALKGDNEFKSRITTLEDENRTMSKNIARSQTRIMELMTMMEELKNK